MTKSVFQVPRLWQHVWPTDDRDWDGWGEHLRRWLGHPETSAGVHLQCSWSSSLQCRWTPAAVSGQFRQEAGCPQQSWERPQYRTDEHKASPVGICLLFAIMGLRHSPVRPVHTCLQHKEARLCSFPMPPVVSEKVFRAMKWIKLLTFPVHFPTLLFELFSM